MTGQEKCKECVYRGNCQFILKHKGDIVEGCTAFKSESVIKSEAVREFAERLKNKIKTECNPYGKPTFDYDTSLATMRYIDNLVKEIVDNEKG